MRHNKIIGWDKFLGVIEQIEKYSPWLSRQIAKRASEWPFWYSGTQIVEWREKRVWTRMPASFRNSVEGEISQGHMVLAAELTLRLILLRYRQEFPFRYRVTGCRVEIHHIVESAVDFKFEIGTAEWEQIRMRLATSTSALEEFVLPAYLPDGRSAGTVGFDVAFDLEKFLPA
jgi:hypothetical protein